MKNRFTSLFFLMLLLAPAVVIFIWLNYQKAVLKHEIKWMMIEQINKEELVLLKFTKVDSETKLKWEHSREFEFNQQMYDVVEINTLGDTIYYWCWQDNEETRLNKQLRNLVNNAFGNNPLQREKNENLITFYKSLYCVGDFEWQNCLIENQAEQNSAYFNLFCSGYFPPQKPPPKLA